MHDEKFTQISVRIHSHLWVFSPKGSVANMFLYSQREDFGATEFLLL